MLLADHTHAILPQKCGVYAGFDPTAQSLHVGSLAVLVALYHFKTAGYRPIALVGGTTGGVGDPSGKKTERMCVDPQILAANSKCISVQIASLFEMFEKCQLNTSSEYTTATAPQHISNYTIEELVDQEKSLLVVNNQDWLSRISMLEFMAIVGKHSKVTAMLAKDSIKSRLDQAESLSYQEFSYQLFQAYDYLHLYNNFDCRVQLGGSDQWGNITSGISLIRKTTPVAPDIQADGLETSKELRFASGVTVPLILNEAGAKFGKTESGECIWLDPTLTTPFRFHQYFRNISDSLVGQYMHVFTLLPFNAITEILHTHSLDLTRNVAQRRLAFEATRMVHGCIWTF